MSVPPYAAFIAVSALLAIAGTFVLANSAGGPETKLGGTAAIAVGFLIICVGLFLRSPADLTGSDESQAVDDMADVLAKLEQADKFATSVKVADVIRLVASSLRDVIPIDSVTLFLVDDTGQRLGIAGTDGAARDIDIDSLAANTCLVRRAVCVSDSGGVAIPLTRESEPFGVLELHIDRARMPSEIERGIFNAIGSRVAPLVLSSIAFERSISNALTDVTTNLPNERALYLILENQIAESVRKPDDRPLALLALDVKDFAEINQRFGHAAGDRVLHLVGQILRDSLRQMDFLARCGEDEFLAVLPTASKQISNEIVERINAAFFGRRLSISGADGLEVILNVGTAQFGVDGETAEQLVAAARLRKDRIKSSAPAKVLWFSQTDRREDAADAAP